ncbi:MAG: CBS domain-containing protein [Planctomycetes bacterium]|nr:CBS domain-containing protein [Planctomycetota bacterium]
MSHEFVADVEHGLERALGDESEPTRVQAKNLMRSDVATLSTEDTIESALALFEEARISGAPVLANGRLVGVLTLADVSRPEHQRDGRLATEREYELAEPAGEELSDEVDPEDVLYSKDDYSPPILGRERVGDWMSEGAVAVPPETPLETVCRIMTEKQIHRVFVTERDKLVGVISSLDIVCHVARGTDGRRKPG